MTGSAANGAGTLKVRLEAMAMAFDVTLDGFTDEAAARDALEAFHRDLIDADDTFSLFRSDTPMARVANGDLALEHAPAQIAEVLDLCEQFRIATAGAFNARRPDGVVDPSGIVKTWAVARATRHLGEIPRWLVSASGDVVVGGGAAREGAVGERAERRVGIADPRVKGDPAGTDVLDVVLLGGKVTAVATSGSSQVADHIWDPLTGEPARHYLQASVAGNDLVACDAWATAICAGGAPVVERAAAAGFELLIVAGGRSEGGYEAVATPGWPSAVA